MEILFDAEHFGAECNDDRAVSPPGETLQEILESRGMSQADLAERTGRPKKTINEIIQGKAAITPETALQLELVLGVPAAFWNARERNYREALARSRELKTLQGYTDWLEAFPYRTMVKFGWIPSATGASERVHILLSYFGVASPETWKDVWAPQVAFRRSKAFSINDASTAAWLRKGEVDAHQITCKDFDLSVFRDVLREVRSLTRELKSGFQRELQNRFCTAGVALVFVPELPETRVWGATRWLTPTKALIQLSLRYKTDDHFWFTLFHEAGHIVLHGKRTVFLEADESTGSEKEEEEADVFARDFLIPPELYAAFIRRPARSCTAIRRFAYEIGLAPGVVVGRLQKDGKISRDRCNELKAKVDWANV